MAAQYKRGQLIRKFHLQKQLQAQPEMGDLTDVILCKFWSRSRRRRFQDEARKSRESKDERVEVSVVNPTSKRKVAQAKSSAAKEPKMFSGTA